MEPQTPLKTLYINYLQGFIFLGANLGANIRYIIFLDLGSS